MSSEIKNEFEQLLKDSMEITDGNHVAAALLILAQKIGGLEHQLKAISSKLTK